MKSVQFYSVQCALCSVTSGRPVLTMAIYIIIILYKCKKNLPV